MENPTIKELKNTEKYELIAELNHQEIKDFVLEQLTDGRKVVKVYMVYQIAMIITGIFFFARSIVLALSDVLFPLYFSLGALVFCFSALIVIHELLHGAALKLTGAKTIHFGGYLKKFIFYAEADSHVLNRKQFRFVALAPLVGVKIISFAGIILYFNHPAFFFFIFVMGAHTLFCAGDIGLLSIFNKNKGSEIFTYDVKTEKKSYFFKLK